MGLIPTEKGPSEVPWLRPGQMPCLACLWARRLPSGGRDSQSLSLQPSSWKTEHLGPKSGSGVSIEEVEANVTILKAFYRGWPRQANLLVKVSTWNWKRASTNSDFNSLLWLGPVNVQGPASAHEPQSVEEPASHKLMCFPRVRACPGQAVFRHFAGLVFNFPPSDFFCHPACSNQPQANHLNSR